MIFSYTFTSSVISGTQPRITLQQGSPVANPSFSPQRVTKPIRVEITGALTAGCIIAMGFGNRAFVGAGLVNGVQLDGIGAISECLASGAVTNIGALTNTSWYYVPAATLWPPYVLDISQFLMPAGGLPFILNVNFSTTPVTGSLALNIIWQELAI